MVYRPCQVTFTRTLRRPRIVPSKCIPTWRRPPAPISFDRGVTAVAGIDDAYVSLLDYDVPRAQLQVHCGDDAGAAAAAFRAYADRVIEFSGENGERTEFVQRFPGTPPGYPDLLPCDPRATRWIEMTWHTNTGGSMSVKWTSSLDGSDEPVPHSVFVEIPGRTLECLEGTPETSPWRIILGHDNPDASRDRRLNT